MKKLIIVTQILLLAGVFYSASADAQKRAGDFLPELGYPEYQSGEDISENERPYSNPTPEALDNDYRINYDRFNESNQTAGVQIPPIYRKPNRSAPLDMPIQVSPVQPPYLRDQVGYDNQNYYDNDQRMNIYEGNIQDMLEEGRDAYPLYPDSF